MMPLVDALSSWSTGGPALRRSDLVALTVTFFVVGITVSALAVTGGTSPMTTFVAAVIMYSATSELAFLAVVQGGGSTITGVLSGWLVASRFGLLAITLARIYGRELPLWKRVLAAYVVVDPSIAMAANERDLGAQRRTYVALSVWMSIGWVAGSVVGILLGDRIGDPSAIGLDAVFPASLVAILAPSLRRPDSRVAAAVAVAVTLVLVELTPGGVPVLLSVVGAAVAVWLVRAPVPGTGPAAAGAVDGGDGEAT
jgi:predicted branched-subunit amino acid permease